MGSRHWAPVEFWKEFSIQLPLCLWKSPFTKPLVTNDSKVQRMTLPLWETQEGSCLLKKDLWDCCCRCDCDEETTLYRKETLKKQTLLGGADGSPETRTTSTKFGQSRCSAQMDAAPRSSAHHPAPGSACVWVLSSTLIWWGKDRNTHNMAFCVSFLKLSKMG